MRAYVNAQAFEETPDANADFSNIIYYLDDTNLQEVKDFFNVSKSH